jgi:hypothetical protein
MKHRQPLVSALNATTLETFVASNSASLVLQMDALEEAAWSHLHSLAHAFPDVAIGAVQHSQAHMTEITLYTSFGRGRTNFDSEVKSSSLKSALKSAIRNTIPEIEPQLHREIFEVGNYNLISLSNRT